MHLVRLYIILSIIFFTALPCSADTYTILPSNTEEQFLKGRELFNSKNYSEAAKIFQKLAEEGHEMAQAALGCIYAGGLGVTKNYSKSLKWLKESTSEIYSSLHQIYSGGTENYCIMAFKEAYEDAETRNVNAQSVLGYMYTYGFGTNIDYHKAFRWLQEAAQAGDINGQIALGDLYLRGQGITQDYKLALKWYKKGAEAGSTDAQIKLGQMYCQNHGEVNNFKEGYAWLSIAAANNWSSEILSIRDKCAEELTPATLLEAQKRARELSEKITH